MLVFLHVGDRVEISKGDQVSLILLLYFLLIDKIAKVADVFDCHVCEVGAGPGSLTRSLLHAGSRHVAAIEIDRRFFPSLEVFLSKFLVQRLR